MSSRDSLVLCPIQIYFVNLFFLNWNFQTHVQTNERYKNNGKLSVLCQKVKSYHEKDNGQALAMVWKVLTVSLTGHTRDNRIMWQKYLAVEQARFSGHHPALDSAAGCSARCRRSVGQRGRPTSRCLRNVGCLHLHSQPVVQCSD